MIVYNTPPYTNQVGTTRECFLDASTGTPGVNITGVYINQIYERYAHCSAVLSPTESHQLFVAATRPALVGRSPSVLDVAFSACHF